MVGCRQKCWELLWMTQRGLWAWRQRDAVIVLTLGLMVHVLKQSFLEGIRELHLFCIQDQWQMERLKKRQLKPFFLSFLQSQHEVGEKFRSLLWKVKENVGIILQKAFLLKQTVNLIDDSVPQTFYHKPQRFTLPDLKGSLQEFETFLILFWSKCSEWLVSSVRRLPLVSFRDAQSCTTLPDLVSQGGWIFTKVTTVHVLWVRNKKKHVTYLF